MGISSTPLSLVGLIAMGFAVFWARQLCYRKRDGQYQDTMRLILGIIGSVLILIGLIGGATHLVFFMAPCVLIIICMLVMRYRTTERRTLLHCISVAAQKGIPIDQAVRGFADERTDELGYRATILAEGLEAGMDLPRALTFSKTGLPTDATLAMRLGCETGTLGPAVSRIAKANDDLDLIARTLFEKFLYLGSMILVMTFSFAFVVLKIAPMFQQMYREYELEIPIVTKWNVTVAEFIGEYWFVGAPLVGLLFCVLLAAGMHYLGFLPRDFPGVGWVSRRFDGALIMRCLAMAVGYSWPMNKTIWQLARIYPRRGMRGRLARAGRQIDNGEDWCNSLKDAGIITHADWSVLKSAQRVGNLEWALDEMADSSVRRLIHRWRVFLNIAFPIVLLILGMIVGSFAVGFFVPIVRLVESLS